MKPILVLDSSPLGLLFQKPKVRPADECRQWLQQHFANGVRVIIPEIVYVSHLSQFVPAEPWEKL